jgi:LPXTG-motif cell wall-anchored protein
VHHQYDKTSDFTTQRSRLLVVLAALMLAAIGGLVGAPRASADEIPGAITSITSTSSKVGQWEQAEFSCTWAVPDGSKPGDTFTLQLPEELKWSGSKTFDLRAPDGSVVAKAVVTDSGLVTFTLTDYVATHPINVHGTCAFTTQYIAATDGGTVELEFQVNDEVLTVPVETQGPCPSGCPTDRTEPHKWMWWADADQTVTQSQIMAPATTTDDATVVITDTPGPGLALDCTSVETAVGKNLDDKGLITAPRDDAAYPAKVACTPDQVTVTWTGLPKGEYTELRVKATVTDPTRASYANQGTISIAGEESPVAAETKRTDASGTGVGTTPAPTTTSPSSTTTTSPTSTTTTTSSSTSSTTSETTVGGGSGGDTGGASVEEQPMSTAGSSEQGAYVQSAPAQQTGPLAYTGATVWPTVAIGLALLVGGGLLLLSRRRVARRH